MRSICIVFLLLLGLAHAVVAQKAPAWKEVDQKMLQMPAQEKTSVESLSSYINQKFKTPQEKVRAVYFWLAQNIAYDVTALRLSLPNSKGPGSVEKSLSKRKGVCHDYAEAFQELCAKVGITAYYVSGYTKQQGQVEYMGHAWCAAKVDGEWFLFDPTWGAGYVDKNKFTKRLNEDFFMVVPSQMMKTHYPLDPLWQLSLSPISAKAFAAGNVPVAKPKVLFQFKDTIGTYATENEHQRLQGTVKRMTAHGLDNAFQKDYLEHLKEGVDYYSFNMVNAAYNQGVDSLNKFIYYRNNRQLSKKKEDEVKRLISSSVVSLQQAKLLLTTNPWQTKYAPLPTLERNLKSALAQALEQEAYIAKHINPLGLSRKR